MSPWLKSNYVQDVPFFGLKNLCPDYVIVAEASALGCKIKWQEDDRLLFSQ